MCETCPCFKSTSSFPVITALNSGVCETKLTVLADYSPLTEGLLFGIATDSDELSVYLKYQNDFFNDVKTIQSSIFNAKKNALASLYGGIIRAHSIAPTLDYSATFNGARCWIMKQSAYEGPCASYLMFTGASVASLLNASAVEPLEVETLTTQLNATLVSVLAISNCCGMTPLKTVQVVVPVQV